MYHIGDWVVRSSDGLCKIADITNPDFVLDSKKMYYQLVSASDRKDLCTGRERTGYDAPRDVFGRGKRADLADSRN